MAGRGRTLFVPSPDAPEILSEIAKPALVTAGEAIAEAIPSHVPVDSGTMKASYSPVLEEATSPDGLAQVRVHVGSPFWHWMEYGTSYNAPYRPVQRAVEGLGVRYEPK